MRGTIATALIALFLLVPTRPVRRGSLVVCIVSQKGDYVVVASESRSVSLSGIANDGSCKIISLGDQMLFYETGLSIAGVVHAKPWDAKDVARAVYLGSKKRDTASLSIAWGNRAARWFAQLSPSLLQASEETTDGAIVTGGFVGFDQEGRSSVQIQTIYYSSANRTLSRRPPGLPPGPGGVAVSGAAKELVQKFFESGPIPPIQVVGVDATTDAKIAQRAIQFAIQNSTGHDHAVLGGPIDIAIIRNNRTIQWVNRKTECYAVDQK